jgi:TetR/AcrR family transcriptional regulator
MPEKKASKLCIFNLFKCKHSENSVDEAEHSAEEKIIIAATGVFQKHGFSGAKMQQIATLAGVNKALLHYYFKNKEQLYISVLGYIMDLYWTRLEQEISKANTAVELITNITHGMFEVLKENPECRGVILQELAQDGPFIEDVKNQITNSCEPVLLKIIGMLQEFMDKGEIRPMNPLDIYSNISGMCMFTFMQLPFVRVSDLVETPIENDAYFSEKANVIIEMTVKGILQ